MPPGPRRERRRQRAHDPLSMLEGDLGQVHHADQRIDPVAQDLDVLARILFLAHVVRVLLAELPARPLLGEVLEGRSHRARGRQCLPSDDALGGLRCLVQVSRIARLAGGIQDDLDLHGAGDGSHALREVGQERRPLPRGLVAVGEELEGWPLVGSDSDAGAVALGVLSDVAGRLGGHGVSVRGGKGSRRARRL
jgi:hypothetical protein